MKKLVEMRGLHELARMQTTVALLRLGRAARQRDEVADLIRLLEVERQTARDAAADGPAAALQAQLFDHWASRLQSRYADDLRTSQDACDDHRSAAARAGGRGAALEQMVCRLEKDMKKRQPG